MRLTLFAALTVLAACASAPLPHWSPVPTTTPKGVANVAMSFNVYAPYATVPGRVRAVAEKQRYFVLLEQPGFMWLKKTGYVECTQSDLCQLYALVRWQSDSLGRVGVLVSAYEEALWEEYARDAQGYRDLTRVAARARKLNVQPGTPHWKAVEKLAGRIAQ